MMTGFAFSGGRTTAPFAAGAGAVGVVVPLFGSSAVVDAGASEFAAAGFSTIGAGEGALTGEGEALAGAGEADTVAGLVSGAGFGDVEEFVSCVGKNERVLMSKAVLIIMKKPALPVQRYSN